MNKFAFVFNFAMDSTEEEEDRDIWHNVDHFFCVLTESVEEIERLNRTVNEDEEFYNFISDQEEKYGIHDVSFTSPYFFGFTTYEISEHDSFEVILNIKKWFESQGFKTSDGTTMIDFDDADTRYVEKELSEEDIALAEQYFWH